MFFSKCVKPTKQPTKVYLCIFLSICMNLLYYAPKCNALMFVAERIATVPNKTPMRRVTAASSSRHASTAHATHAIHLSVEHSQEHVFYLDPINSSIYHFSLRLNLVEQYRPQPELEDELVTAFDVSPTRAIFIALENKIYLAYLP